MKKIIGYTIFGILIGCAIFTITGVYFDITNHGSFSLMDWSYTKMVIGAMIVGIGFSIPSLVYESKKLHYAVKVLIHMGIGCTVFILVAFSVGWIPVEAGWKVCALIIAGDLLFAFAVRFICSYYFTREAKQMNEKIQMKRDES